MKKTGGDLATIHKRLQYLDVEAGGPFASGTDVFQEPLPGQQDAVVDQFVVGGVVTVQDGLRVFVSQAGLVKVADQIASYL